MSKHRHFDDYSFSAAELEHRRKEENHKHCVQPNAALYDELSTEAQQWLNKQAAGTDFVERALPSSARIVLEKEPKKLSSQSSIRTNRPAADCWDCLDRAITPEYTTMELLRCGEELAIFVDGIELMASGQHGSEELMAYLCALLHNDLQNMNNGGLDRLSKLAFQDGWHDDFIEKSFDSLNVLIGGLGLGYTLKAALRAFPQASQVVVAELMNCVADWNRGILGKLADFPLRDPRAHLFIGDVREAVRSQNWDVIMLDVDNGPEPTTQMANHTLYSETGLKEIGEHLNPGGVLSVWSVGQDSSFIGRLQHLGFVCRALTVPSVLGSVNCDRHTIFFAYQ
ncbi:MAG: spermidine synthase [Candidatus Bruticola sp.]